MQHLRDKRSIAFRTWRLASRALVAADDTCHICSYLASGNCGKALAGISTSGRIEREPLCFDPAIGMPSAPSPS